MNKLTLLPLLLALSAFSAAEVRLYGELKSGVETSQTRFNGDKSTRTDIADFGSRIGIRGSHPIGGGSSMIWQTEQDAPVGSSRTRWEDGGRRSSRDSGGENYIGVKL